MNESQQSAAPDTPTDERAIAERRELQAVLSDLWQHSETLVRQEVELLKAEYEARAIHAKAALQRGAIAMGLFHAAYLTTLATLVLVLAQWIEPWIASLIVAIAASGGAFAFAWMGKQELKHVTERREPAKHTRVEQHGHSLGRQRAHS